MINLTIRTLESGNFYFSLEDQSTVLALKHKIRDSMHIELHNQRLIYGGRILTNDINLTALDVDGKVIHLVKKAPPGATTPNRGNPGGPYSASPSGAGPSGAGPFGAGPSGAYPSVAGPSGADPSGAGAVGPIMIGPEILNMPYVMNDTDRRLVSIREFLLDIQDSLHSLQALVEPFSNYGNRGNGFERPRQREITRPQTTEDFIYLYRFLDDIEAEFRIFKNYYVGKLQHLNGGNEHEVRLFREYMEKMNSIHHSLAHVNHALSELSIHVDTANAVRMDSEPAPIVIQAPLPVETITIDGTNMNLERHTTFVLADRNEANPPARTIIQRQNVAGAAGNLPHFDTLPRSHPNPRDASHNVTFPVQGAQGLWLNNTPIFQEHFPFPTDMPGPSTITGPYYSDVIYDRFMYCDSRHAVAAMLQRRYHLTSDLEEENSEIDEMLRSIENSLRVMTDCVPGLTEDYITLMTHLLCLSSFNETYMNASLTLLVRHVFVNEPYLLRGYELPRCDEFVKLRNHHYSFAMNILMATNNQPVNYIMDRLRFFLVTLPDISQLRPDLDLEASLRAYFDAHLLNHLINLTADMTESIDFIINYFNCYVAFFSDVCDIIKHHCLDKEDGFSLAFHHFMHLLINNMEEGFKPLFTFLIEVLRIRFANREQHMERVQPFIQVRAPAVENRLQTENQSVNNAQELTPIIVPTSNMIVPSDDEDSMAFEWTRPLDLVTLGLPPMDSTTTGGQAVITLSSDEETDCVMIPTLSDIPLPATTSTTADGQAVIAPSSRDEDSDCVVIPNLSDIPLRATTSTTADGQAVVAPSSSDDDSDCVMIPNLSDIPLPSTGSSSSGSENNAQECTPVADDSVPRLDMIGQYLSDDEDLMAFDLTAADGQSVISLSDEESDCASNFPPSGSSSVSENREAKAIAADDLNTSDAPEHNWEQRFMLIFKSDEEAQKVGGFIEPLSDAYLAGMSASKRRCVRRQRPPCKFEDFLTACIEGAGTSPHMTENDMRVALSVHMCNLGSTRFSSNEDVNEGATSGRFMYIRKYLNSERPNHEEERR